jgi:hypothetical protein
MEWWCKIHSFLQLKFCSWCRQLHGLGMISVSLLCCNHRYWVFSVFLQVTASSLLARQPGLLTCLGLGSSMSKQLRAIFPNKKLRTNVDFCRGTWRILSNYYIVWRNYVATRFSLICPFFCCIVVYDVVVTCRHTYDIIPFRSPNMRFVFCRVGKSRAIYCLPGSGEP